jgi:hypothetical protein
MACAAVVSVTPTLSIFAADALLDVSRIIDKATAQSILETKVKDAAARNVQGGDGYYSKCNYYSIPPGKTLVLRIYRAADGYDPQNEFEAVLKNSPSVKNVFGIGDKSFVAAGVESALPKDILLLYILKKNTLVTVGVGGFGQDAAFEKAKTIAQKILTQL